MKYAPDYRDATFPAFFLSNYSMHWFNFTRIKEKKRNTFGSFGHNMEEICQMIIC